MNVNIKTRFEWDIVKEQANIHKHGINFSKAKHAFLDRNRIIYGDFAHSTSEKRYFCVGKVQTKIVTVRFTYRHNTIRIFGAAYWRKGKKLYEKKHSKRT
jgi:uncharacterized DUF497 family protein